MSESELVSGNVDAYRRFTEQVLSNRTGADEAAAMAEAIGASSVEEFHRTGQMEADLLVQSGLADDGFLVDVGCGSGRLASKLRAMHSGGYLGTEISPDLLRYAEQVANRPDWTFSTVAGLTIPRDSGSADMVCFFSVLTHLRHEESYLYLEEARRVLAPGGRIVFTFLDFSQPTHRTVFEATVEVVRGGVDYHVNQFISKDAITLWASMLGLEIEHIHDGSTPYITLSSSPYYDEGSTHASLGQSACVLLKR
jgi:ubiquinone/menaquinone biosynthesis C-methylase UbiE